MPVSSRLSGRLAVVVSLLALVAAMGGTSYAAAKLAAGSVGTVQLKDEAVTSRKIKDGTIRRVDLYPEAVKKDVTRIDLTAEGSLNNAFRIPGFFNLSLYCSANQVFVQVNNDADTANNLMGTGVRTADGTVQTVGFGAAQSFTVTGTNTFSLDVALAAKGTSMVADLSLHGVRTGSSCRYVGQVVR